jgi:hypothetical protein
LNDTEEAWTSGNIFDGLTAHTKVTFLNGLTRPMDADVPMSSQNGKSPYDSQGCLGSMEAAGKKGRQSPGTGSSFRVLFCGAGSFRPDRALGE